MLLTGLLHGNLFNLLSYGTQDHSKPFLSTHLFFINLFIHFTSQYQSLLPSSPSQRFYSHFPLLFSSEKGETLPVYHPILVHKVTAGLATSSPTEDRQDSPARRAYPHRGNSFWTVLALVVQDPHEGQAAHLLHMCGKA